MAPFKMPMIMWNMTTFPIERLCFDLQLEILEQLEAKDVIELVKVNQGFQWMISSRPSIVFGHHVDDIRLEFEELNIKKLNSESLEVSLDVTRHFPFIKNIRSCNQLSMRKDYDSPIDKDLAAFLKQLKAVNLLYLDNDSVLHLDWLSHLSMKIKRCTGLPSDLEEAPSIRDLVGHFIEAQLNQCEMVRFSCNDDDRFHFYYNALIRTHIKYVVISGCDEDLMVLAIQRILSHGIPSKNPAGIVSICSLDFFRDDTKATIVALLKGYPGMKQISRKNRQPVIALANDRGRRSRYPALTMKTLCLRRNINPTRDCIYMWYPREFLAFYIKPDEVIDY